jgi:hypothetical protein
MKNLSIESIIETCIKLEKNEYKDQARVIWNEVLYPFLKDNKDIFFEIQDMDEYYNGSSVSPGAQYSYKEIVLFYEDLIKIIGGL